MITVEREWNNGFNDLVQLTTDKDVYLTDKVDTRKPKYIKPVIVLKEKKDNIIETEEAIPQEILDEIAKVKEEQEKLEQ